VKQKGNTGKQADHDEQKFLSQSVTVAAGMMDEENH
jgi:hypothetical protein